MANRRYHYSEEAFALPLTKAAEYWTGFLAADGCVHNDRMAVVLNERDAEHLEKLKRFCRSDHPVRFERSNNSASFRIYSPRLCEQLAQLGVTPRKSLIATAPDFLCRSRDYWRGVIDGDGHIDHEGLTLVGGQAMMLQFADFAHGLGFGPLAVLQSRTWFRASCNGKRRLGLIDALYRDTAYDERLNRKFEAATTALKSAHLNRLQLDFLTSLTQGEGIVVTLA